MPKTLKKFCAVVKTVAPDTAYRYLDRMVKMYGLNLSMEGYDKAYLALCDRFQDEINVI